MPSFPSNHSDFFNHYELQAQIDSMVNTLEIIRSGHIEHFYKWQSNIERFSSSKFTIILKFQ
jgi:hypothetical protein